MPPPDWEDPRVHWTLVALLDTGEVGRTQANASLVDWLREAGWIGQGARRDLFRLDPVRRGAVGARLAAVWPHWASDLAALSAADLPRDATGLRRLRRLRLPQAAPPPRLHRKTWTARHGAHSKSGAPDLTPPPGLTLTDDDLLRLRPHLGMQVQATDGRAEDCARWVRLLGELVIPERALDAGLTLAGTPPRWVMTVENLGAYLDLAAPPEALIVHQPGWNSRLARRLVDRLDPAVPWWHFGDLDPAGLAIFATLGDGQRRPRLFIPDWWAEYLDTHGLPLAGGWPEPAPDPCPALVGALHARGRWLEQEVILLDPRLPGTLRGLGDEA